MDTPDPGMFNPGMLIAMICLLLFSAFFSAAETAINSLNRIRLKHRVEEGDDRAIQVQQQVDDYDRTLATILIGNNVVNLSLSSLATVLFTRMIGAPLGPTLATIVMTVLVLIFGEILPKSYAKQQADDLSDAFAPPLQVIKVIFTPLVFVFTAVQRAVASRRPPQEKAPSVTEDELKTLIGTVQKEGVLDAQESGIMRHVIDLEETTAQDVLIPRVDLVALEMGAGRQEILDTVLNCPYTRIPLYRDSIDHCVGMLHTRDLLARLAENGPVDLESLRRDILFVYRTKRLNELLAEFRYSNHHIAVVTDDYGGTLGIVTMEDILEELVGEIFDETDKARPSAVLSLAPGLYRVEGDTNFDDMLEAMNVRLPKDTPDGDYSSAAGWALDCLAHIPTAGERFRFAGLEAVVGEMEGQRIASLIVRVCE